MPFPTYPFDRPGNSSQPHVRCPGNDHGDPDRRRFCAGVVDRRRLYHLALDRVAQRRFLTLVKGRSVSIGKCTSDNGGDVHGKRVSTCTATLPHVIDFVSVTAPTWRRPCRSGDNGGGRERPPSTRPLDRARRGNSSCRRAAAGLVLEVGRGVCHTVRRILDDADGDDDLEIGREDGRHVVTQKTDRQLAVQSDYNELCNMEDLSFIGSGERGAHAVSGTQI